MIAPRRWRAPQEDRAVLALPPVAEVGPLVAANRQRLEKARCDFLGRALADLQAQARRTALDAARQYLLQAGEPLPPGDSSSLLLAGHQPELFHPGVWIKNFALNRLARAHGLTPINLVVDNDTVKSTALKIPHSSWIYEEEAGGAHRLPKPALVPFDHLADEIPYEERQVQDEAQFANFPAQAATVTRDWDFQPILPTFWAEVCCQGERTRLLGERFAAARRTFERRWGCHNFEVPVSALCQTEPFAWFILHLLAHLPRFHALYNACLKDYRRTYCIRSRAHPVPDLAAESDWLEVPLWAWRPDRPRRGRLMARLSRDRVELRVGAATWPELPLDPEQGVAAWRDLERQGYKLRSRALTNTLYARLLLADLFIHGIGGGKYDELTDEIARRFYGFEPPAYLVLSGTLRLPFHTFAVGPDDCRWLARELRDIESNPQRHLLEDWNALLPTPARELANQKQHWIAQQAQTPAERRERFHVLKNLTDQLQPFVAGEAGQVRERLTRWTHQVQVNAVLRRRDYAFCLFPEEPLREFLAGAPEDRQKPTETLSGPVT